VTTLIWQFSYLQVLDFLTTVAFLLLGIQEGNPVVRFALELAPSPIMGLAVIKVIALALAVACLRLGKLSLLARANVLFAIVVAWNMLALIVGAAQLDV
jgi:hypothetical protein